MARADYSALAGSISLGAPPPRGSAEAGSGSGGNPDLKPIRPPTWMRASNGTSRRARSCPRRCSTWTCTTTSATARSPRALTTVRQLPGAYQAPYLITVPINCQRARRRRRVRLGAGVHRELRLHRQLHLRRRQADLQVDRRRRSPGGHLEEHLQRHRLLREQALQRAGRLHLPLRVLQRAGPLNRVHAGQHRYLAASLGYTVNDTSPSRSTA